MKQGFKRTVSEDKHRSQITAQSKNNNLEYMIDPTFRNISIFFVLSFKYGYNDPAIKLFDKYYIPLLEIKDFYALIDNKLFFDRPAKKQRRNV